MINIDKIYDLMSDKGFQEPRTGNLFFPAYIYTYPPEKEYEIRTQIDILIRKLERPSLYLNCLVVNIYHEIIEYLKSKHFAGESIFDIIMEMEKEEAEDAFEMICDEINGNAFYEYIENKLLEHFKIDEDKRVYLIIYGFGSAFPYLRASKFLTNVESFIKRFKMILFYPGEYKNSQYHLFGELDDDNMYRANHLNKLIGEDF